VDASPQPVREAAAGQGGGLDRDQQVDGHHAPGDRPGPPEVRRLAAAFNDMAARLGRLLDSQRAFVADASHQLRTPLTALRLRLENLEATMPPTAAEDLRAAAAETGRLARLVDGLFTLTRAEAAPTRREVVDLAAVVADRRAALAPLAAEQDVELTFQPGSAAPVWAVPSALEQVLDNLLANALRFTPPGSQVELAIRQVGGWVELHVTDQGPGMPAEQRQRAFDRFWRAPSADGKAPGWPLFEVLAAPQAHHLDPTQPPTAEPPPGPQFVSAPTSQIKYRPARLMTGAATGRQWIVRGLRFGASLRARLHPEQQLAHHREVTELEQDHSE
jgi:signal transduction histidine kinase